MQKTITTITPKKVPQKKVTTVTTVAAPKNKQRRRPRNRRARGSPQSPYVMSLLNPDGVRGASIPDSISMATGTYSSVLDFSIAADASNGNMIVLFNPKMYIGNAGASTNVLGAGLVAGSPITSSGYGTNTNPIAPLVANPNLSSNVERFRVVSAELQLYSTQAPLNIQGRVTSFLLPSDYDLGSTTVANSFAAISQLPNSVTTHLIEGGRSLYLPGGPDDLLYAACADDSVPIHGYIIPASGAFHATNLSSGVGQQYSSGPTLGIAVNGCTGSASLSGRMVVNIQYIATSSNAFVNLEPVLPDPAAVGSANILASFPRKLQGFLNTHSEQIAATLDSLGTSLLNAGMKVASNAAVSATNAMLTQQLARAGGGQRRLLMS